MSPYEAMAGQLFDEARRRCILTIGIGDGGNEIGMGVIRAEAEQIVPSGAKCTCPCQGGIIDATEVDVLVVVAVSNWGAYGIEACLAAILYKSNVLHDAAMEMRMISACANAGAIDGISCLPELAVDGLPAEIHVAVVNLLAEIVRARAFGHPRTVHLK